MVERARCGRDAEASAVQPEPDLSALEELSALERPRRGVELREAELLRCNVHAGKQAEKRGRGKRRSC